MKTFEEFELTQAQIDKLKSINAKNSIKKYVKKYAAAPENAEEFYTYTEEQYDAYKRLKYAEYVANELMSDTPEIPIEPIPDNGYKGDYTITISSTGSVTLWDKQISNNSLYNATNIETIKIGNNLEIWPTGGLNDNVKIEVSKGNTHYDCRENCNSIIETSTNTLISGCSNSIIPTSVVSIKIDAFKYCTTFADIIYNGTISQWLENNNLNDGLCNSKDGQGYTVVWWRVCCTDGKIIYDNISKQYEDKTNVHNIYFLQNLHNGKDYGYIRGRRGIIQSSDILSEINKDTFTNNAISGLTYVILPDSLLKINNNTFYNNHQLTYIEISNSLTTIGEYAFGIEDEYLSICPNLIITYKGTMEQWNNIIKDDNWTNRNITVNCIDGKIEYN